MPELTGVPEAIAHAYDEQIPEEAHEPFLTVFVHANP